MGDQLSERCQKCQKCDFEKSVFESEVGDAERYNVGGRCLATSDDGK
jgi:hypothetical protein